MSALRIIFFGILVLLVSSCGQIVTENLPVASQALDSGAGGNQTVMVLLPFADYSQGDNIEVAYKRNMLITETFTDQLAARGFQLPVQEDVFKYLVDNKIINVMPAAGAMTADKNLSLQTELKSNWSDAMKTEIANLLHSEQERAAVQKAADNNPQSAPGIHGLDQKSLAAIGAAFGADYIVRGRIIEYDLNHESTWEPQRKGLLPFVYGATNQMMFGVARSDTYDTVNSMVAGGAIGAVLGNDLENPYDLYDATNYRFVNSMIWGGAGAALGYLVKNGGGDPPQAVVQLRVWIQDAASGKVIWTNRARVKVAPESVFADSQTANLFDTAVNKAVTSLVNDFLATAVN